ncbi:DEAD/DEAH box helicase domain-containing protein [Caloramator quimbayensis]|uniref:DEAD/DEAH box helicase domain-containing protein n=1 Tax=Caloramator quimbayensis TaxID=1147123 RepID=A0A1T4XUM9_9CLOT|nr:DEAD/DEAH box helicase [Caloramator quimbayensis]SKA93214.1 DEAD/DEAH box helicase domain-containing protein [Caloramator quimbayensis]
MKLPELKNYENRIIGEINIDKREPIYMPYPENMSDDLKGYLKSLGIEKIYSHQYEMFERAIRGENVIITTSTASGKTLSFLLPVAESILKDKTNRALFIYPTKALAHDQFRNFTSILEYFGEDRIQCGIYDGDTPPNERTRIRKNANIILTNPEMINSAFLPNHSIYGFNHIFSRLKYIVIDELHVYRGAFGSHMANVIRRLNRICRYYKSNPQFLFSSATIANPVELAENIGGKKFSHIYRDGSMGSQKTIYIWQPPFVRDTEYRKTPEEEASDFVPDLVQSGRRFITFCKSRREVEVVLKEARDRLSNIEGMPSLSRDLSDRISGYRGGYTPTERKEIEKRLSQGLINGVIATNALELGIDIGSLEIAISCGFPGTKASFWQQVGRAGRKGDGAVGILILDVSPLDQYIAINGDYLVKTGVENAVIDKDNLFIQLAHVRAAAAELPLSLDDASIFPDIGEIIPVLIKAGELKNDGGVFTWIGKDFPAGDFNLRNISSNIYKVINKQNGTMLTEMDEYQAFHEVYPKAIYIHDGMQYLVESLDLTNRIAQVIPVDMNYFTVPFNEVSVGILREFKNKKICRSGVTFGDVNIKESVPAYKMIQFHNRQNLGFEPIVENLFTQLETEGMWYLIPDDVDAVINSYTQFNYYNGIKHALLTCARMRTMATAEDIGGTVFNTVEKEGEVKRAFVILYDLYPGGLGFTEKAFEFAEDILNDAINLVKNCRCHDGCPACVGDYHLDKKLVLWSLEGMLKEREITFKVKEKSPEVVFIEEKICDFEELPDKWEDFIAFLNKKSETFVQFFSTISGVSISGDILVLNVNGSFFREWIMESANKSKIENIIKRYVNIPKGFKIDVCAKEVDDIKDKIMRRYDDLTK